MTHVDITPPPFVLEVAEACEAAGGRALLVGGSVRDHFLGLALKDWDLEVHGLSADRLEEVLHAHGRVNTVGRSFAVFKVKKKGVEIDVSLPRRDSKAGPGHRGIVAVGDPHMGLHEAARRRDLTVNAMMVDPLTRELIDPFSGLQDLRKGILREVDAETFLEDPLRTLRVVQFAARLGFTPTDSLVQLGTEADVHELPPERIQGEWSKLFLRGHTPSAGLRFARTTWLLPRIFPEADAVDHPERDDQLDAFFRRTSSLLPEGQRFAARLGCWMRDASRDALEATFEHMNLYRWMSYPIRRHMLDAWPHRNNPMATDASLRHLSTRADVGLTTWLAESLDGQPRQAIRARAEALGVLHDAPDPILKGRHLKPLGVPPGPHMGELLQAVYTAQLDGHITDLHGAQAAARSWLADNDIPSA